MKYLGKTAGVLLLLLGIGIFSYPTINRFIYRRNTAKIIKEFQADSLKKEKETCAKGRVTTAKDRETRKEKDPLFQEMENYNEGLVKNGQQLLDAWKHTEGTENLKNMDANAPIGYVNIPDMNVMMPIYMGASVENMAKGAVVLAETSLPIGGKNTNCVIAAHRGFQGKSYFLEIENLKKGSYVYVTNAWETLTYEVREMKVIEPDASDQILIQNGKDMITLLTCHPYMGPRHMRYLVYCDRVYLDGIDHEEEQSVTEGKKQSKEDRKKVSKVERKEEPVEDTSKTLIALEKWLRIIASLLLLIGIFVLIFGGRKKKNDKE